MPTPGHTSKLLILSAVVMLACDRREEDVQPTNMPLARETALQFGTALANRDYAGAYAMTTVEFRATMSLDTMQATFEEMVPLDWVMGPIDAVDVLEEWPDMQAGDLGMIYVSIGGEVYSEGVTVIVNNTEGEPRVRQAEFGRP